jgi:uncharacterized protein with PIN domain
MGSATPTFAADRMVGRLAKWLRLVGLDTLYEPSLDGPALARRAAAEGRVLLTRDTRLLARRDLPRHLFIDADDFRSQLKQVLTAFAIDPHAALLTRCSRCNELLEEIAPEQARPRVPPYVASTVAEFARCPRCARVYWSATHVERLRRELDSIGV